MDVATARWLVSDAAGPALRAAAAEAAPGSLGAATRLRGLTPSNVGPWTQNHSAPKPAARSLHDMAREHLAKKSGDQ